MGNIRSQTNCQQSRRVSFASTETVNHGWRARYPLVLLRGFAATEDTILRLMVDFSPDGSPSGARPKGERRMVDQNIASWNQFLPWLRRLDTLRSGQALTG